MPTPIKVFESLSPRCVLFHGNAADAPLAIPVDSLDALITDPPYELGFMGRSWDQTGIAFNPDFWKRALAVLKPGAHALIFGGSRTYHRIACAVEDAGFEIRDCVMWMYGTGFPKSLDISKAIDAKAYEFPLFDAIRAHICHYRDAAGMTNADLNRAVGSSTTGCGMARHWTSDEGGQHAIPSKEQWLNLKAVLKWPDCDLDAVYSDVKDGAERPVIGQHKSASAAAIWRNNYDKAASLAPGLLTASATDLAKKWEGWGTALKPAFEPVIVARKPLQGTVAANVLKYGVGGMNVDACRIASTDLHPVTQGAGNTGASLPGYRTEASVFNPNANGRWPANVILDDEAAALLDLQSGPCGQLGPQLDGDEPSTAEDGTVTGKRARVAQKAKHGPVSGASRFFYCAKASRSERDFGCDALPPKSGGEATDRQDGSAGTKSPRAGAGRTGGARNFHPTVKPQALMRYLCRLVTPPGGTVLDLFTGSGSTGVAALAEGFGFVGFELTEDYLPIIKARLGKAVAERGGALKAATLDDELGLGGSLEDLLS